MYPFKYLSIHEHMNLCQNAYESTPISFLNAFKRRKHINPIYQSITKGIQPHQVLAPNGLCRHTCTHTNKNLYKHA